MRNGLCRIAVIFALTRAHAMSLAVLSERAQQPEAGMRTVSRSPFSRPANAVLGCLTLTMIVYIYFVAKFMMGPVAPEKHQHFEPLFGPNRAVLSQTSDETPRPAQT